MNNFVRNGARTRDLAFQDGKRFSGFLSALVKWLLGTVILRPDLYGPVTIYMMRCGPDQDLGLFCPKQQCIHHKCKIRLWLDYTAWGTKYQRESSKLCTILELARTSEAGLHGWLCQLASLV